MAGTWDALDDPVPPKAAGDWSALDAPIASTVAAAAGEGDWSALDSDVPPAPSPGPSRAGLRQRWIEEKRRGSLLTRARDLAFEAVSPGEGAAAGYLDPELFRKFEDLYRRGAFPGAPPLEYWRDRMGATADEIPVAQPPSQGGAGIIPKTTGPHLARMTFYPDDPATATALQARPMTEAEVGARWGENLRSMIDSTGDMGAAGVAGMAGGPLAGVVAAVAMPKVRSLLTTTGPETARKPSLVSTIFDAMDVPDRVVTGLQEAVGGDRPHEKWYETVVHTAFQFPSYSGSERPRDTLEYYRRSIKEFGGNPDEWKHIAGGLAYSILRNPATYVGVGGRGVGTLPIAQRQVLGKLRDLLRQQGKIGPALDADISRFAQELSAVTPNAVASLDEYRALARATAEKMFGPDAAARVEDIGQDFGRVGLRVGLPMTNKYAEVLKPSEWSQAGKLLADALRSVKIKPRKQNFAQEKTLLDVMNRVYNKVFGVVSPRHELGMTDFDGAMDAYTQMSKWSDIAEHEHKVAGLRYQPIAEQLTEGVFRGRPHPMLLTSDELTNYVETLPKTGVNEAERQVIAAVIEQPWRASYDRVKSGELLSPVLDATGKPRGDVTTAIQEAYGDLVARGRHVLPDVSTDDGSPAIRAGLSDFLENVETKMISLPGITEQDVAQTVAKLAPAFPRMFVNDTLATARSYAGLPDRLRAFTDFHEVEHKAILASESAVLEPVVKRAGQEAVAAMTRLMQSEREGKIAGLQTQRVVRIAEASSTAAVAAQRAELAPQMVSDAAGSVAMARARKRVLSEQLTGHRQSEIQTQKALTSARQRLDRATERETTALRKSGGDGAAVGGDLQTEFVYFKREAQQLEKQLTPASSAADAAYNRLKLFRGKFKRTEAALRDAAANKRGTKRLTVEVERLRTKIGTYQTASDDASRILSELEQKAAQAQKRATAILARSVVPGRKAALESAVTEHDVAQTAYRAARDTYRKAKEEFSDVAEAAQQTRSQANVLVRGSATADRAVSRELLRESGFPAAVDAEAAKRIESARSAAEHRVAAQLAGELQAYQMHVYRDHQSALGRTGKTLAGMGGGTVTKHRTFPSVADGIEAGLNPADDVMVTLAARQYANAKLKARLGAVETAIGDKRWAKTAEEFKRDVPQGKAGDWAEMVHPYTGETHYLRKGVAKFMENALKFTEPGVGEQAIALYQRAIAPWKGQVTHGRPIFYNVRNWVDDGYRMWMAGVNSKDIPDAIKLGMLGRLEGGATTKDVMRSVRPKALFEPKRKAQDTLRDAFDEQIRKLAERPITNAAGQTMTMGELFGHGSRRGVVEKGYQSAEVAGPMTYSEHSLFHPQSLRWEPFSKPSLAKDVLLTPARIAGKVAVGAGKALLMPKGLYLKRTGEFAAWNENVRRLTTFISRWKAGDTLDDAATAVNTWNLNYKDATRFERLIMRSIEPFYMFDRKVIPAHIRGMVEHPGRYIGIYKAVEAVNRKADSEYGPDAVVRSYLDQTLGVRLPLETARGSSVYWVPPLSMSSVNRFPLGNVVQLAGGEGGGIAGVTSEDAFAGFSDRLTPVVDLAGIMAGYEVRRGMRQISGQRIAPEPATLAVAKSIDAIRAKGKDRPGALIVTQRDETGREFETVPVWFSLLMDKLAGVVVNFGKFAVPVQPDTTEEEMLRPFPGVNTRIMKELTGVTLSVNPPGRAETDLLFNVAGEGSKLQQGARAARKIVGQGTKRSP